MDRQFYKNAIAIYRIILLICFNHVTKCVCVYCFCFLFYILLYM
jgi:hypothetical protein